MVGNDIPVFFGKSQCVHFDQSRKADNSTVQDAMKFPDVIHAGKPEPNNEVPVSKSGPQYRRMLADHSLASANCSQQLLG